MLWCDQAQSLHDICIWHRAMNGKKSGESTTVQGAIPTNMQTSGHEMASMYGMRSGERIMTAMGAATSGRTR